MKYNKELLEKLKKLGHNIKKQRKQKRRITILELSKRTGIRKEYLQKIEDGTYGVLLNTHIVKKIANALEITLYEIFEY